MSQELLFDIKDKIATITLNRPEKLNAFTNDMIDGYYKALLECRDSDAISVVILTGAGRAFCAGGDVGGMGADGKDENKPLNAKNRLWHHIQRIPKTLIELDKPIIAAVNGVAVGAGMDLAQMCDMRIAGASARFAESYVKLGIVPGAGGAYFLPRLVGPAKALELLLTGDFVLAEEALRLGLVNHVYPDDELMDKTYELAGRIAANAPVSLQLIKRAMYQSLNIDLRTHLDLISSHMSIARGTDDHVEAIAAFKEKRKANFKGN